MTPKYLVKGFPNPDMPKVKVKTHLTRGRTTYSIDCDTGKMELYINRRFRGNENLIRHEINEATCLCKTGSKNCHAQAGPIKR